MKVLHVIDRLSPGGAEKIFVTLTDMLMQTDVEVAGMVFNDGYPLEEQLNEAMILHVLQRKNKYSLITLYKAHKTFSRYNIVHAHLRHVHAYVRLAQLLFRGKYKLVLHDHGQFNDKVPLRLSGVLKPNYYIGVNKQQVNKAQELLNINPDRVFLLENVINKNAAITRKTNRNKKAIMVANIRSAKNIAFAADVMKAAGIELTVYGNRQEEDYYKELKKVHPELNIVEGVTNLSDEYDKYQIAIHTASVETGPLVLQEYLAAGLPFITYNTGTVVEKICAEIPEFIMDDFEVNNWVKRINTIQSAEGIEERMQTAYSQYFNPEKYRDTCLEIYRRIHS